MNDKPRPSHGADCSKSYVDALLRWSDDGGATQIWRTASCFQQIASTTDSGGVLTAGGNIEGSVGVRRPNGMREDNVGAFEQLIAQALERIAIAHERQGSSAVSPLAPAALSKQDAARYLGVELATIEYLVRIRRLAYVQLGSQRGRVIRVEDLRKLVDELRRPTADECRREGRRLQSKLPVGGTKANGKPHRATISTNSREDDSTAI
jgi:hypothetical protein